MRVLLAEDDDEAAGYVERGLEKLGHRVVRVSNGEEALQFGTTERFDMIVLDRMMPKREGLDVLRGLRSAEIETPVLVLTRLRFRRSRRRSGTRPDHELRLGLV